MRERDLDEWWARLPAKRKAQIHSWLAKETDPSDLPNQLPLFPQGQAQKGEAL